MRFRLLPFLVAICVTSAQGGGFALFEEDSISLDVGSYRTLSFSLQEYHADSARIQGEIILEPDTMELEFLLLHLDDYNRWAVNDPAVDTLAFTRAGSGSLDIEVPGFGWLVLVICNRGNSHIAVLTCSLRIEYSGSGLPGDPLPSALRMALLLLMGGAIAIALGGVLASYIARRGKKA